MNESKQKLINFIGRCFNCGNRNETSIRTLGCGRAKKSVNVRIGIITKESTIVNYGNAL